MRLDAEEDYGALRWTVDTPQVLEFVRQVISRLEAEGVALRCAEGVCDRALLARIHRYTLNRLRREIEPVSAADFQRFLIVWQRVEPRARAEGVEALAALSSALREARRHAWHDDALYDVADRPRVWGKRDADGFFYFTARAKRMIKSSGFNVYPAQVEAVLNAYPEWKIPGEVIAIIPTSVALSVMLQVSYFKLTRRLTGEGRRIFKMAPLHHHFELIGWTESQVVIRFWLVAIIFALFSLTTLKLR